MKVLQENRKNSVCNFFAPIILTFLLILSGCQKIPNFPDRPIGISQFYDGSSMLSYDTTADSVVDYAQVWDADGRVSEIRYLAQGQQVGLTIKLSEVERSQLPHFIIALDGVPFELVQQLYQEGAFRLFGRPAKVVSCFPGMTDLAYAQVFSADQPLAYEAEYFDRATNRIVPGNEVYLSGENADWVNQLSYRCSFFEDAIAYVAPEPIFGSELRGMNKVFDQIDHGQAIAYVVSTAALGTRGGREDIIEYLLKIDRYCQQLVYERRGRVMITLMADHGHTMQLCRRVDFAEILQPAGYRLSKSLEQPKDVVAIAYGLVTCAAFHTNDAPGVADVLLHDPRVRLAAWPDDNAVMVASLAGQARIENNGSQYRYIVQTGDPLGLNQILAELHADGLLSNDGWIDDDVLFAATTDHQYPDAVKRLYESFNSLVRYPSDLLVSLADGWCNGSSGFEVAIGRVVSTHGSLNYGNSMTFAMTMWGDLPEALRLEQVIPAIDQLRENSISAQN